MMQCPNCNTPLDNEAVFCGNCGRQVTPLHAQGATIAEGTQMVDPGNVSRGPIKPNVGVPNPASFSGVPGVPNPVSFSGVPGVPNPASFSGIPGTAEAATQRYGTSNAAPDMATQRYGTSNGSDAATQQYDEANVETQLVSGGGYNSLPGERGQSPTPPTLGTMAPPTLPPRGRPARNNTRVIVFIALILVLLVAGISAGVFALTHNGGKTTTTTANNGGTTPGANGGVTEPAAGLVSFIDSQAAFAQTDQLNITISNLTAAPSGSQYNAWLVDDATEQITALGPLVSSGNQKFTLNFIDKGANLIGLGNRIEVTQEQGKVTVPQGKVILLGVFPTQAFVHIRHLLFQFPDAPNKVGLVVGMRDQAQKLNNLASQLQGFSGSNNIAAMQCAAQGIINIDEGKNGADYQPLADTCATFGITDKSDGFGILTYAARTSQHAALAANQSDSTDIIKTHAGHVEIAATDITTWTGTVNDNALNVLKQAGDIVKEAQKIVKFANQVLNGVDINGDESVDPVPGEAAVVTAYVHAQFMAQLPLKLA